MLRLTSKTAQRKLQIAVIAWIKAEAKRNSLKFGTKAWTFASIAAADRGDDVLEALKQSLAATD